MPPSGNRRDRDEAEEQKPVKAAGRPAWVLFLAGFGVFLVLLLVTAFTAAWLGAQSVARPSEPDEEEEERILEESLTERLRLIRGLDLARERPPLRMGERDRLMTLSPRLSMTGSVTDAASLETIEPEIRGELDRPLVLRKFDTSTLERGVEEVSAPLGAAGNLGRAEPVVSSPLSPRPGGVAETGAPDVQTPDARPPAEESIEAFPGSTIVVPPGYTIAVTSPRPSPSDPASMTLRVPLMIAPRDASPYGDLDQTALQVRGNGRK